MLARHLTAVLVALIASFAPILSLMAGPVIDTSVDRARTPIEPGFQKIGTVKPRSVHEISGSNWTLGCETLDRDYAEYEQYKSYLEPLGIKTIRLQAGWAKTEKVKGTYDFTWLDRIIDDAHSRGLNILLETGYGNPAYEGGGGWDLAGGFPSSTEALAAWDRWVETMADRYQNKVLDWAMWNEPDINKKHTPRDIANFHVRTARTIKRIIPKARIAGLSLASSDPKLLDSCLSAIREQGQLHLFDWFIYHGYAANPDSSYTRVEALKEILGRYSSKARMRQGENGCPSELTTKFALSNHPWTEQSQAKWDLRRMLGDLGHEVESAVFTICDFNHVGREINRKGLLRADADKRVNRIKLAYYSVQNVVSVFDDRLQLVTTPDIDVDYDQPTAAFVYRRCDNEALVIALWDKSGIPGDSFATRPARIRLNRPVLNDPVWVDLVSGGVYEIPGEGVKQDGKTTVLTGIPVYDAPVLIAERSAIPIAHSN